MMRKQSTSSRLSRKNKQGAFRIKTIVGWLFLCGFLVFLLAVGIVAGLSYYYLSDPNLPKLDSLKDYHPKLVTKVYARDGKTLLGEIYEERRTMVSIDKMDKLLIYAFLDAEDAQFLQHRGLNYFGMMRAFLHNIRHPGGHLQGASSLTQQVVKNYILKNNERSVRRKIQEAYLSLRLEEKLTKNEILEIYLNEIYFGRQNYGIEEAARCYFGKSVQDQTLTLAEMAALASFPKEPEAFSLAKNIERLRERQKYVLSQMVRHQHITKTQEKLALETPLTIRDVTDCRPKVLAQEFVDEAERQLQTRYTKEEIPYLGLNIQTTCDADIQKAAQLSLEQGLQKVDERNGYQKALLHLNEEEIVKYKKKLDSNKIGSGNISIPIFQGVVEKVYDGENQGEPGVTVYLGDGKTGWLRLSHTKDRYNPKELSPSQRFQRGDIIRVKVHPAKEGNLLSLENGPQGAIMVLDPKTRHVLAMVGGYGYHRGQFNRALRAERQPGSAFKPFLYTAALESRKYTPATLVNDSPQIFDGSGGKPWVPRNAEEGSYRGPIRLRVGLANSLNTIASQVMYDIGAEAVVHLAKSVGIQSKLQPYSQDHKENLTLALGSGEVTLKDLTNGYATLSNQGQVGEPIFLISLDSKEPPVQVVLRQALKPELAFLISSMLQSVVEEGTARSIRGKLKRPIAGKTGTTNKGTDVWFVGYTPDLVTGVWVGFDDPRYPVGKRESGAKAAIPIWLETMKVALKNRRPQMFVMPPGVVSVNIDPKTGKLAAPGGASLQEFFLEGTEPKEQASPPSDSDFITE